jgi:aminomethyltransferase
MKSSPLESVHIRLGAKLTEFGGWNMPLSYPSGTLSEHHSCRTGAALFDVSHLGTVRVTAFDSVAILQSQLSNDILKIGRGKAQYTHLLDDDDGSVVDDIIVWWRDDDSFDVMPNASNTDRVLDALGGEDVTHERAVIALQGPNARNILEKVSPEAARTKRFHVFRAEILGARCVVAGTGYTGEDGFEIAVPADQAEKVWDALMNEGGVAAGLGARDTLRLEAGLPLHGHELGPGITPLQANLEWVVAWNKERFRGRKALEREKAEGVHRHLVGLSIDGRRPAREGSIVKDSDGNQIGMVTSGNFSPTLEHCIAFAFVNTQYDVGQNVIVDVRGTHMPASVAHMPFYKRKL